MAVRTSTKNARSKTGAKFPCAIASLRARADSMEEMEEAVEAQAEGTDTGCRQTRRHDRRNGQGLYLGLFCLYISSLIATELQEAVKTFYIGLLCLYIRSRLSI